MFALMAAAVIAGASPAPTAAPSPLPDGTYTYVFRQGTTTIGTAAIAIDRSGGAVKTHEIATLMGRSFAIDQTLDAASFVPRSLDGVYPGARPTAIHIDFGASAFDESIAGMGSKSLKPAAGAEGIVALDGPVMSGFFIAPAQARTTGSSSLTGISPGSEAIIPITLAPAGSSARPPGVPATDPGFTTSGLASGEVTIWYDPATLVPHDFEVPAQGISIALVQHSGRPAMGSTPPAAPTPLPTASPNFKSVEVVFKSSDGTRLAGTLTIPHRSAGTLPAVVLVHGSGPTTRDERVGPNPIFLQLSNALSNHGYIVLRYDKRGVGKSGGDLRTTTRDQLLADARAAVAFVAARREADPRDVFVVGHSEGGELAPSLAAGGAPLRGIALMAPPAIPLERILLQQATRGLSGDAAGKAAAAQEHEIIAIRSGASNGDSAAWLRSSFGVDPAEVIKNVPCPILILQGGKDFQVLPKDLPRLVHAAGAAHRHLTVRVFPNDDHLFIAHPSGQQATPAEYLVPHHVDPAMIEALVSWLDSHR